MGSNISALRYIDLSKYLEGKKFLDSSSPINRVCTDEELNKYSLILKSSTTVDAVLRSTEDSSIFWKACNSLKKYVPEEIQEDLFYTYLLDYKMSGVPSKLVYILEKAKRLYDTPNVALSMINRELLSEFFVEGSMPPEYSIVDVVANVWGGDVKLMSPYRKRSVFKGLAEVYVEKTVDGEIFDKVVVLPVDISNSIGDGEVGRIVYNPKLGLEIEGRLLRKYNERLGITESDIDLRSVE